MRGKQRLHQSGAAAGKASYGRVERAAAGRHQRVLLGIGPPVVGGLDVVRQFETGGTAASARLGADSPSQPSLGVDGWLVRREPLQEA